MIKKIQFMDVTDRIQEVNGVSFLQVDDRVYMLSRMEELPTKTKLDTTPVMRPFDQDDAVTEPRKMNKGSHQKTQDAIALGKKILARREALGLDVAEFAKLGGTSRSMVWAYQAGRFCHLTDTLRAALKRWKIKLPPKSSCLHHHPKSGEWEERRNIATV
jgi:DNA-binding transcriptional regulator YiaG